ncbi:hypothetical protein [Burkholderia vietnamiensis]|uniref:hypothetical protein n=1 Tax=Burkholderia vietnamiensis TaxID=60552 RepID=UPI001593C73F|nr:hypothetical protein [Burkholderia vietnamiensis]
MTTDNSRADALTDLLKSIVTNLNAGLPGIALTRAETALELLAASPVEQHEAAPVRCGCCGYLVTDSEHRGCLRAAQPEAAPAANLPCPVVLDRTHPNEAYVTLGFDDPAECDAFLKTARRLWESEPLAQPEPAAADERAAWQTGVPPVKKGSYAGFIVACRRKHNGEVYVFEANYANQYAEELRDDDGEEFTAHGWYDVAQDIHGEYSSVFSKTCGEGDEILGWQPLPKWSDESARASSPNAAEPVAIPAGYALVPIEPTEEMIIRANEVEYCEEGITRGQLRAAIAAASPPPALASTPDEDAYVVKHLSEALADVYTTLIGDDKVDADDGLNAIQRVEKAAQVLRLEVELYRAQASAPVGLTEQAIADAVTKWFPDRAYQAPFFARELLKGDKQ